jgi:tetratricopeptide (TPR) repeat protein
MLAQMLITLEKYSPEVCCVIGNYYSLKGNHEKAVVYFQRAIRLDAQFVSAYTLMGHEYMELRNTSAAIVSYRQAIGCNDTDFRAWYGLGQTYEMLHLYSYAYYYYQKATYLRPNDARMWSAVGNCLLKLSKTSEAMVAYERAVNCGDREGIATRDLAKLYKEERLFDKASTMYYAYLLCNFFDSEALNPTNKDDTEENEDDSQLAMPSDLSQLKQYFHAASVSNASNNEDSPSQDTAIVEAVNQIWNHNFAPVEQLLDAEQAEALLYLANFFLQVQINDPEDAILAEFFLSRYCSTHFLLLLIVLTVILICVGC